MARSGRVRSGERRERRREEGRKEEEEEEDRGGLGVSGPLWGIGLSGKSEH